MAEFFLLGMYGFYSLVFVFIFFFAWKFLKTFESIAKSMEKLAEKR